MFSCRQYLGVKVCEVNQLQEQYYGCSLMRIVQCVSIDAYVRCTSIGYAALWKYFVMVGD
jgi:hypothetical protein